MVIQIICFDYSQTCGTDASMNRINMLLSVFIVSTAGLVGCGGDDEVSLSTQALPLVKASCGGCHARMNSPAPAAVANMVYLEQASDLTGLVGTFIVAGDSASSGFIKILRQEMGVGANMTNMPPPPAAAMSTESVDMIAKWVDEGAQDN